MPIAKNEYEGVTPLTDTHPEHPGTIRAKLRAGGTSIELYFEDYGVAGALVGHGPPVIIEHWGGELRVIVWADINSEDPTHIISLEGAKETCRAPENEEE